ncbi:MAG TPA: hypothetical protein VHR17_08830 [Thermoanaerobaculia bacterium]|nr:hypothetical protein [Thermoanaerobaculia bacterium]
MAPAIVLTLPAALLVLEQAEQIRYEELNEAVRGPFWLEHRLVFDGVSTNVGWYGLLVLVYRVFGFGLGTARWARVALLALGLIALSALLHRHLRRGPAVLALLAIALSPTLLYLNRITTSYGTDLLILPFCLLLLDDLRRRARERVARVVPTAAALGAVAMIGAMVFPAMVISIPFLAAWAGAALPRGGRLRPALAGAGGFVLPLALATVAMRDPRSLYWDPIDHAGIFRGGAGGWVTDPSIVSANLSTLVDDLFRRGSSYYFELRAVEFGGWLGRASFAGVVTLAAVAAWKVRSARPVVATAAAAALLAALATSAAAGPPGLRRATAVVAAFYLMVPMIWVLVPRLAARPASRATIVGLLLLLPIHHLLAYGEHLKQARTAIWGRERVWFGIDRSPEAALEHWVSHTAEGRPLDCRTLRTPGKQACGYDYIYAAIGGFRRWNGEPPIDIRAVDPRTGEAIVLSPFDWRSRATPAVRNRPRAPS